MIEATPQAAGADPEAAAIEAGASDFEPGDGGATTFYTEPADLDAVSRALPTHGFTVQSAQLGYRAKNPVTLGAAERAEVEAFLEAVDADDDVQNVFAGLAG
jgi:transcriptional/translational regulatory protein YebC/TACO1